MSRGYNNRKFAACFTFNIILVFYDFSLVFKFLLGYFIVWVKLNMNAITSKRSWADEMDETRDNGKSSKGKTGGSRESSKSRKKSKPNNKNDTDTKPCPPRKPLELETDPLILQRRQKQIDYGKNTVGYHNYIGQVKIDERTKDHPKTPDKFAKYSRRSWDTLIRLWRKKLHEYDTNATSNDDNEDAEDSDSKLETLLAEIDNFD